MTNLALKAAVDRVLHDSPHTATQFTPTLRFYSETNDGFDYTPINLRIIDIVQNFGRDYTDGITVTFMASGAEYATLFEHAQGLMASLSLQYLKMPDATPTYTPAPRVRQYRAMLVDAKDLRSQLRDAHHHVAPNMPVTARLIDTKAYELRQARWHGILHKTTLDAAIRYIVQAFNISALHLVPPDNTHVWDHIVVPPSKTFSEVFEYLQTTYGVYLNGIEAYYSDGTAYVYPPFDHTQSPPHQALIYAAVDGSFAGMEAFHTEEGGVLEIVSTGVSTSQDLTTMAAENHGTGVSLRRASLAVDGATKTDVNGTQFTGQDAIVVRNPKARTMAGTANNTVHAPTTDNVFLHTSEMAKYEAVLMKVLWGQAVPFLLKPGHPVRYSYDQDGAMTTAKGIVEAIGYRAERGPTTAYGDVYACGATLVLRLDPPGGGSTPTT